ncbi:MAG: ABC transporter ATP-binding protein [Acidimicrobiales bacterium]
MTAAIELQGITKRFPGVVANDRVTLTVETGEIHAICGENGAGKSTLMKILYGMQPADEGTMIVNGETVTFTSPSDAIERGIGMVHQHFMLADQLTVMENVILGSEPVKRWGVIDTDAATTHLSEVADAYGLEVDPNDLVETLEVGERQRVEIIKVLFRGARILILDEPTAVLVPQEVEELFRNLRELKADGATIIFIDHKLDEVLAIADTITVIRQGRTVGTVKPGDVTALDLAEMMVGSELPSPDTQQAVATSEAGLTVEGLTVTEDGRPVVNDVSFTVHRGEIVGIAGVEGNGQTELVDAIIGTHRPDTGSISLLDADVTHWSVRKRRESGLGYVPQDRHDEGLLLEHPLWENAALGHQTTRPFSRGWFIDRPGSRQRTEEIRAAFDVRTPNIEVSASTLSGGNQQKLIIGRELLAEPKVLIAGHPTRGIDVGAQAAVWEALREARADGLATLLISADLDELIGLSDRILVMLRGQLVGEVDPAVVTPRDLGAYMTGAAVGSTS